MSGAVTRGWGSAPGRCKSKAATLRVVWWPFTRAVSIELSRPISSDAQERMRIELSEDGAKELARQLQEAGK